MGLGIGALEQTQRHLRVVIVVSFINSSRGI